MTDVGRVDASIRTCLGNVARDLHTEFQDVFGDKTMERLRDDGHQPLGQTATLTRWLGPRTGRSQTPDLTD